MGVLALAVMERRLQGWAFSFFYRKKPVLVPKKKPPKVKYKTPENSSSG